MNTTIRSWLLPAAILTLALLFATAHGQQTRIVTAGGDDIEGPPYNLAELGAVIVQRAGALEVLFVAPPPERPKGYADVDVEAGDRLMMLNGKKLKTVADLEAGMNEAAVGEAVKIGLKRGKDLRMIAFPKADPDDLPRAQMMMKHVSVDESGEKKEMHFTADGEGEPLSVLVGGGLLVKAEEGRLVVAHLLPDAGEILGAADVRQGDLLISLQGEKLSEPAALDEAWSRIETGDEVALVLARDGKEFGVNFIKAEAPEPGMMMIKK